MQQIWGLEKNVMVGRILIWIGECPHLSSNSYTPKTSSSVSCEDMRSESQLGLTWPMSDSNGSASKKWRHIKLKGSTRTLVCVPVLWLTSHPFCWISNSLTSVFLFFPIFHFNPSTESAGAKLDVLRRVCGLCHPFCCLCKHDITLHYRCWGKSRHRPRWNKQVRKVNSSSAITNTGPLTAELVHILYIFRQQLKVSDSEELDITPLQVSMGTHTRIVLHSSWAEHCRCTRNVHN